MRDKREREQKRVREKAKERESKRERETRDESKRVRETSGMLQCGLCKNGRPDLLDDVWLPRSFQASFMFLAVL